MATWSNGTKVYAEHGPDGECDGWYLERYADERTGCFLLEHGKRKDCARVHANGHCTYNNVACEPDDSRLLPLIAQVAPV